jgi:radical SAM-linked protein
MDLDEVTAHIMYLKEKTKHIKGLKINYHEKFVSQIEAVLTRGDSTLCKYIEALYKKGCYLDSWGEHFDKEVWKQTAEECGLSLGELAKREFDLHLPLPWDFINVGLDKSWLQKEYQEAMKQGCEFNLQPTCEQKCVNCGVCKNLKTHKVLAKPYKASEEAQDVLNVEPIDVTRVHPDKDIPVYRYRLKITKKGLLKYFSHLDWQNTFFKAISRSDLKVAFSCGYNPTMKISMGIALPLFCESTTELVDIELLEQVSEQYLKGELTRVLPKESQVVSVEQIERSVDSIEQTVCWAEYKISLFKGNGDNPLYDFKKIVYNTEKVLSSDEIYIEKKNKKGLVKKTDIKRSIGAYRFEDECLFIVLKAGQGTEIPPLRADVLMDVIAPGAVFDITRVKFLTESLHEL